MCWYGHSLFCVFWSFSHDPGLQSTISFRLRVLQVSTFPSPSSFSILNGRIICFLFYVLCFFPCTLLFLFHVIVCFGMHFILSKHVSAQKLDFLSMNVCVHKWASIDTHAHTRVWKHMRWGIWVFFFETQYLLWCLCISFFLFFLGHYVVHLLFFFLGCVATHAFFFFMGHILKIMGWVRDLPYLD